MQAWLEVPPVYIYSQKMGALMMQKLRFSAVLGGLGSVMEGWGVADGQTHTLSRSTHFEGRRKFTIMRAQTMFCSVVSAQ